ncbi:hypothetical protein PR048_021068 [Dryococelus australis]|uniref:DUF5641 domain-containing protein n=1 Tax=Dryococelus australis TaxID=614101 RepID=A0ABQ9GX91_9NEOP|nr:hypothetical protein PR048_021068 [Dryococelus australis]
MELVPEEEITNYILPQYYPLPPIINLKIISSRPLQHWQEQESEWHFIPPRASHFSGLWEAGVRSMKHNSRRAVVLAILSHEGMYTVLTEIKACLNSWPRTPMSSEPSDLKVLTPTHFLMDDSLTAIPEPNLTFLPRNTHAGSMWMKKYVMEIQQRAKRRIQGPNVYLDSLVWVKEDNVPPLCWKLARVKQLHPGKDGDVRVVTVPTAWGELKRAISQLCPLPKERIIQVES